MVGWAGLGGGDGGVRSEPAVGSANREIGVPRRRASGREVC